MRFHILKYILFLCLLFGGTGRVLGQSNVVTPNANSDDEQIQMLRYTYDHSFLTYTYIAQSKLIPHIKKYDLSGKLLFQRDFKSWKSEYKDIYNIVTLRDGGFLVMGHTSLYSPDLNLPYPFLLRFNACGEIVWKKIIITDTAQYIIDAVESDNGDIITTLPTGITKIGAVGIIYKFDKDGNLMQKRLDKVGAWYLKQAIDTNYFYSFNELWIEDPNDKNFYTRYPAVAKHEIRTLKTVWHYPTYFDQIQVGSFSEVHELANEKLICIDNTYTSQGGIYLKARILDPLTGNIIKNIALTDSATKIVDEGRLIQLSPNRLLVATTVSNGLSVFLGSAVFTIIDTNLNIIRQRTITCDGMNFHMLKADGNRIIAGISNRNTNINWDVMFVSLDTALNDWNFPATDTTLKDWKCSHAIDTSDFTLEGADTIPIMNDTDYWSIDGVNIIYQSSHIFQLYPNPSNGLIYIEHESGINIKAATFVDITGKEYPLTFTKSQNQLALNTENISAGLYILLLHDDKSQEYSFKVVVR
jgi:hypothetical protein